MKDRQIDAEIKKGIDARTKEFKEKITKLAYERIKKQLSPALEPLKGYPHNESMLDESVNEAKKLGSRVKITKGRFAGKSGIIRQMDNGRFKGDAKSFDIDLDDGKEANGVPGKDIKIVKESVEEVSDFKKREIENELRREKPKKGSKKPRPNKAKSMGARRTFGGPSEEVEEAVDTSLVKKAVELALKMGGDMSGATKKIEKMMKGLSKNKEVAAALQLANEEVSESVLDEALQMNAQESKKAKYKAFFDKALMKFGVKSPAELKGDKKKEFFDYVDANYEAENETD